MVGDGQPRRRKKETQHERLVVRSTVCLLLQIGVTMQERVFCGVCLERQIVSVTL